MTNLDVQHRLDIYSRVLLLEIFTGSFVWVWFLCFLQVNIICGNCVDGRCKGLYACAFFLLCSITDVETLKCFLILEKLLSFHSFFVSILGGLGCICSVTQDSTCRSVCYFYLWLSENHGKIGFLTTYICSCTFPLVQSYCRVGYPLWETWPAGVQGIHGRFASSLMGNCKNKSKSKFLLNAFFFVYLTLPEHKLKKNLVVDF